MRTKSKVCFTFVEPESTGESCFI